MGDLQGRLIALETALHNRDVRADRKKLTQLLHPDFIEFGYSGKIYNHEAVVSHLLSEPITDTRVWTQNYKCTLYTPTIAQLRYLSAHQDGDGELSRHARRSSIWVNETGQWQMKFHQATPATVDPLM